MLKYLLYLLGFSTTLCAATAPTREEIASVMDGVKEHISLKMAEATVELVPFPHIVIKNILPEKLYAKMQAYWPASKEFVGGTRRILPVTQGCIEQTTLPTNQKVFWRCFGEIVVHKYIKPALIEKLSPFIGQKFKLPSGYVIDPLHDFHNYRIDMLTEDQDYAIPAHVDQLNVFAALLIYMPTDDKHTFYGTEFCTGEASNDPNNVYIKKGSYLPTVKQVPYAPNTLVCFLQTPLAWHQVRANNDKAYVRKMYIAPINFSPTFMEKVYPDVYKRTAVDDYLWDNKYLCKKNWADPWGPTDHYK